MKHVTMDEVIRSLREWIKLNDPHVQAAVELLITHDMWLRRDEFRAACVRRSAAGWWIDWEAAREAFNAGQFCLASTTEIAMLNFAIALGEDRYRFNYMGEFNTRLLFRAFGRALGGGL